MKSFRQFKSLIEGRPPTTQMDEPFVTDAENKPLNYAKDLAAKSLKKIKGDLTGQKDKVQK
jgi:hypothetical protein